MTVTTPEQMKYDVDVNDVIFKFEDQLSREPKGEKYYHLIIIGEYSREVCDKVAETYRAAGWDAVCKTSSENNERPGLTGLQLLMK